MNGRIWRTVALATCSAAAVVVANVSAAAVGAHRVHEDTPIRSALACEECHACPGAAPVWGALAAAAGAAPAWNPEQQTCSGVYCHGARMRSPPAESSVPWVELTPDYGDPARACSRCHGWPPPDPHPQLARCDGCHAATVRPDGTIETAGGHHVDGILDFSGGDPSAGCAGCHPFPPSSGAHAAHFALSDAATSAQYGDVATLRDRFPGATPTSAPAVYAFGCGSCHPVNPELHLDGLVEVEVGPAAAPAGSLKARALPAAAYDPASGTCSGVYCHSSGQEYPAFVVTPPWRSGTSLACDGCHANPPRYASGGAGTLDANTHLVMADDGWELGHFLGLPGPWHTSKHGGGAYGPGEDSTAITCQTCHYDTTDPASTGPSGFYWLDTTGRYTLPGGDPGRVGYQPLECAECHRAGGPAVPGAGRVLPLRHVDGVRDVVFDPRSTLPELPWLPAAPSTPTLPYWVTNATGAAGWPIDVTREGATVSFTLLPAAYDPATKTCTSVACHLVQTQVTWGESPVGWATCGSCHGN